MTEYNAMQCNAYIHTYCVYYVCINIYMYNKA